MVTTIRMNEAEEKFFGSYAEITGKPMSTLLKDALREQIEDELDLQAGLRALRTSDGETVSLKEIMADLENE